MLNTYCSENIKAMIDHWLSTPVNGYFGQSYGCNVRDQLLKNLSSFSADRFIEKMKADIPILGELDIFRSNHTGILLGAASLDFFNASI